jgi:hypothetical protein
MTTVETPLTYTRAQAIEATQMGKDPIDAALKSGALRAIRIGKENTRRPRWLIRRVDLDVWLEKLAGGGSSGGVQDTGETGAAHG